MSEPRTSHDLSEQTEAYGAEACSLSPSRPPGLEACETVSPVHCPIPMDVDTAVHATAREQGSKYDRLTFAELVSGLNTSVFRPTPAEASFFHNRASDFGRSVPEG